MRSQRLLLLITLLVVLALPLSARAQDTVIYYHTDAIGSVRAITDNSGAVVARYDYLPFGELWATNPPPATEVRKFAGKERDDVTGLDYFGARYHRAVSGRFTSVDPLMNMETALTDPQRFNRYSYAKNNPFVFVDPDGRDIMPPLAFQQHTFTMQTARNLTTARNVLINWIQAINSRGHDMTPEALETHFYQPSSAEEAKAMQLFDVAITAAGGLAGTMRRPSSMDVTNHGTTRIAGQGATRGGTLTQAEINSVRQTHSASYLSNANGATAFVSRTSNGRFNVVIEGSRGYMTSYRSLQQKDLDRLAKRFGWEGYEYR
jgi:RHS repeat-associated protein